MSAASGATAKCALPSGGQLPAPAAAPPAVTVIVTAQGQESITMECAIALFRFARELPSAEYVAFRVPTPHTQRRPRSPPYSYSDCYPGST